LNAFSLHLAFLSTFGDAFNFIFHQQEARTGQTMVGGPHQVLELSGQHLKVTFLALGAAIAIALPVGVILGHLRKGETFAIALGNAGRAVPELALIAFVAAFIGVGLLNVTFAFAVLGIPPILTNSYVGISQVDRNAVEAARGMGMRGLQVILRVELPLAVPTIMAGIRTAGVNIIATVALASLAGLSTLGDFILGRNVYGDQGVVAGAILIALLTLALEFSLAGLQWLLTPRGLRLARAGAAA
jgi:osmoprotectant transport system permease protein